MLGVDLWGSEGRSITNNRSGTFRASPWSYLDWNSQTIIQHGDGSLSLIDLDLQEKKVTDEPAVICPDKDAP